MATCLTETGYFRVRVKMKGRRIRYGKNNNM